MTDQSRPIRYRDTVETPAPEEDAVIASMTRESETTAARYNHAVRAAHAKIGGIAVGEFQVLPGLPDESRQGLFAEPGAHPAIDEVPA